MHTGLPQANVKWQVVTHLKMRCLAKKQSPPNKGHPLEYFVGPPLALITPFIVALFQ